MGDPAGRAHRLASATGLSVTTEPPGAKLRLDGVPLATTAPTTVTVWRDRGEHTIEATLAGYQLARETIRYDKAASLSYVVRLLLSDRELPWLPAPGQRRAHGDRRGSGTERAPWLRD